MVAEVAVDVLEASVPVQHQVAWPEGPQPGHAELDDVLEVPEQKDESLATYFLPVGTCRGLTSAFLGSFFFSLLPSNAKLWMFSRK